MINEFCIWIDPTLQESLFDRFIYRFIIMIGTSVLIIPLNLMKDISKLRFSTIFGIFCLSLIVIVIIIQLPQFYKYNQENNPEHNKINWYNILPAFNTEYHFFKATATILFAYNCHFGAFPVYDQLANNNVRRTEKVLFRSTVLDCTFFLIVGISGYITQPYNTPELIISRQGMKDSKDYIMTFCKIAMALVLVVKIPVNYNSFRISFLNLVFKDTQITNKR